MKYEFKKGEGSITALKTRKQDGNDALAKIG